MVDARQAVGARNDLGRRRGARHHHAGILAVGAVSATAADPGGVKGLLEGNPHQLLAQVYGVVITLVWTGALTFVILKVVSAVVPLRVRREDEIMGLDVTQHGEALQ